MACSRSFTRIRGMSAAAAIAVAAALPALSPAEAVPGYDGMWSVVILTQSGICEASYRYPIRIINGNVTGGNVGNAGVSITGKVGRNGTLVVNVNSGDKSATGTGRLTGRTGSGSWSGGNGACTGIWQAERRGS